jgi:hypothetical protein
MASAVSGTLEEPAFEIEYPKGIFWGDIDTETKVTVVVLAAVGFLSGGVFTALALAGGGTGLLSFLWNNKKSQVDLRKAEIDFLQKQREREIYAKVYLRQKANNKDHVEYRRCMVSITKRVAITAMFGLVTAVSFFVNTNSNIVNDVVNNASSVTCAVAGLMTVVGAMYSVASISVLDYGAEKV